jgi:uncharacterized protein
MASTHPRADRTAHSLPHPSPDRYRDRRLAQRGVPTRDPITAILERCRTIAVVGLSSKLMRPSYGVAAYLKNCGYRIIPVNPYESSVLGERSYASLDDVPEAFDIVLIFRQPKHVPELIESAIRRGARVVWMQEGVSHPGSASRAAAAGLQVVQDRCILKEHAKRFVSEGI